MNNLLKHFSKSNVSSDCRDLLLLNQLRVLNHRFVQFLWNNGSSVVTLHIVEEHILAVSVLFISYNFRLEKSFSFIECFSNCDIKFPIYLPFACSHLTIFGSILITELNGQESGPLKRKKHRILCIQYT